jgi:predicted transcriptional regulator
MTLLTIREASRLIGRTPATIRRYIRSGRLEADKEMGKFGEEYKIDRDRLLALGFSEVAQVPARVERSVPPALAEPPGGWVPAALYNELLMKHEQILVQYGMIRAGGQKLLEYKADSEAKEEDLRALRERYQSLRVRAAKEIRALRRSLRQAEIEIEDRSIELRLLQERVKRLEGVSTPVLGRLGEKVVEIHEKQREIARLEGAGGADDAAFSSARPWCERPASDRPGEDH